MAVVDADVAKLPTDAEAAVSHSDEPNLSLLATCNEADLLYAVNGEHQSSYVFNLPPTSCVELPQARQRYRNELELAMSIFHSGQLQNGAIAYLDEEHCLEYLADLNEWFGKNIALGDPGVGEGDLGLVPDSNGMYRVVIFGHRRRRAVKLAGAMMAKRDGVEPHPDYLPFACRVYTNISFFEAKREQLTENKRDDVEGPEEAIEMAHYYRMGKKRAQFTTQEECAERLGIKPYELKQAVRFSRLPQSVQDLAFDDAGFYPAAAALARLVDYCDEAELYQMAYQAVRGKWTATRTKAEVYEVISVRELPEEVQTMLVKGLMSKEVAIELSKLRQAKSARELCTYARVAVLENWDLEAMRSKVREIKHNQAQSGFNWQNDEYEGAYQELTEEMAKVEEKANAAKALSTAVSVFDHYVGLAINGLAGGMEPVLPHKDLEAHFRSLANKLTKLREYKAEQPELIQSAELLMGEIAQFLGYEPEVEGAMPGAAQELGFST